MSASLRTLLVAAASLSLTICAPAFAEVVRKTPDGFVTRSAAEVAASPAAAWEALIAPAGWWNPLHSFSGDAANLTIASVASGCFCERLPGVRGAQDGGVEHMRVINVESRRVLRMVGALGPLQSEAVNGVLTITLKPTEKGTRVLFEYVVGGFMRYTTDEIAPVVDKVLADQLARLALKLDPSLVGSAMPSEGAQSEPQSVKALEVGATNKAPANSDNTLQDARRLPQSRPQMLATLDAVMQGQPNRDKPKASKPAAPARDVSKSPVGYVQRTFLIRRDQGRFLLDQAQSAPDQAPLVARFARQDLAAKFEMATKSARDGGVVCLCTGSYVTDGDQPSFLIIAAEVGEEG